MDISTQPITTLKGVGPKLKEKLARLGLRTVQDVLFHLPFRYQDRTKLTPIGRLRPGREALIAGTIEASDVIFRKRRALLVRMADGTGHLHLRFFYFNATQQEKLKRGQRLRVFGEVRFGPAGYEMAHPEYQLLEGEAEAVPEPTLTPVYPATEGVSQFTLRKLAHQALERYGRSIPEWLPDDALASLNLPTLEAAVHLVHEPPPGEDLAAILDARHPVQARLIFEELLAHHLSLMSIRAQTAREPAPPMKAGGQPMDAMIKALPFSLTGAQRRVIGEIRADLAQQHPMQRLVQGDVGSGKTVVAAAAAMLAIESGYQAAVMAPTELLAEQHLRNFTNWLQPLGIGVTGLSGKLGAKERREALAAIAGGTAKLVIGTHALFEKDAVFHRLGLIVVDEQHRFGVVQRLALREKGAHDGGYPHQLIMSATPIPRTLAQSLYADLDVSVIDELPPGRKPVETVAVPAERRDEVVARVRAACQQGRQAYWVCPLIEESELLEAQAAEETHAMLSEQLSGLNVALVHGRLRPAEKEKIMAAFKAGKIHVLVATTVIEVGVDVPNASLMIIENAERLGLSQLHQLRGRVGRGTTESVCVLLYEPPLGDNARERIAALRETNDGFEIARRDMALRGHGELHGTRQAGMPAFHIADLMRDARWLEPARELAARLLKESPERVPLIVRRWLPQAEILSNV
jgi:ATP-dependent DNA helicase RecG